MAIIDNIPQEKVVFVGKLLYLIAYHDKHRALFWNTDFEFFIVCNDLFAWACADLEEVKTDDDLVLLEQSFGDSEFDGELLYCCRRRQQRPQIPYYKYLEDSDKPLFDACGMP